MASNADPFVVTGRVISDVVDMFIPSVNMSVYFGNKKVINASDIKPSVAVTTPRVNICGYPNQCYTLVMIDPNAPSPSEPDLREWVHWIVTDISGCGTVSEGKEIMAYSPPLPKVEIHRYIMVLFEQKEPLGFLAPPSSRAHFYTRGFAHQFNLGPPAAVVYFYVHRESSGRRH
ncbi:OLC1v1014285C1 [Oldenlandia corymbosa var. corymbosa]|uniref:OLC1v1014285C1 n=1 Tax=Oldenlandia corymbosa var. corymbosa TaxID=529605 RepID=A0AAV1E0B8_OLDCO|nr:OLC1v1014285C1 [Oldenlandia corymbosa var. corymbosa]